MTELTYYYCQRCYIRAHHIAGGEVPRVTVQRHDHGSLLDVLDPVMVTSGRHQLLGSRGHQTSWRGRTRRRQVGSAMLNNIHVVARLNVRFKYSCKSISLIVLGTSTCNPMQSTGTCIVT